MVRYTTKEEGAILKMSRALCETLLEDLEKAKRPVLKATKCSLDNAVYSPKFGYLTPGSKKVASELNVSSVKKMSRALFMLEMLLRNVKSGKPLSRRNVTPGKILTWCPVRSLNSSYPLFIISCRASLYWSSNCVITHSISHL